MITKTTATLVTVIIIQMLKANFKHCYMHQLWLHFHTINNYVHKNLQNLPSGIKILMTGNIWKILFNILLYPSKSWSWSTVPSVPTYYFSTVNSALHIAYLLLVHSIRYQTLQGCHDWYWHSLKHLINIAHVLLQLGLS